jgi:hypothetical protein
MAKKRLQGKYKILVTKQEKEGYFRNVHGSRYITLRAVLLYVNVDVEGP